MATAIITPDGGPLADVALFIPLVILMEAAVQIARRYDKPEDSIKEEEAKCKFCGRKLKQSSAFCPKCHRSQF